MKHLYDITKSFEENAERGPFWEGATPKLPSLVPQFELFGKKIISPFGVSACPLTVNSKFISLLSNLGYGFFTYKSVRTVEWHGNIFPHWKYVDQNKTLTVDDLNKTLNAQFETFNNDKPTMANSFGVMSPVPTKWIEDVNKTRKVISANQLLILSLIFTAVEGRTFVEDAKLVAMHGNKTTADAFEINLAHPNTTGSLIYEDIPLSTQVCKVVKEQIGSRPLIAKVSYYRDPNLLKMFLEQTRGIIAGISSTNTYGMKIVDGKNNEAFPGRLTAGVSGHAIKGLSQEQAKRIVAYKKELKLDHLTVMGIGGVVVPKDIDEYLDLGVDAVEAAVGVYENPYLGIDFLKSKKLL